MIDEIHKVEDARCFKELNEAAESPELRAAKNNLIYATNVIKEIHDMCYGEDTSLKDISWIAGRALRALNDE